MNTNPTEEIARKAEDVRNAASELSNRIVQFTDWLSKLPGKTATDFACSSFTIRFDRDGKKWALYAVTEANAFKLEDSSLTIKLEAVANFPNFLLAMQSSQEGLIRRIDAAIVEFDSQFGELLHRPTT